MPHRTFFAATLFAAVLVGCAAAGAFAQTPAPAASPSAPATGKPAPSPSASASAAPAPTPTPYKLITISGYGDAGLTSVGGADSARFTSGTPSRVFDVSNGAFFDSNGGRLLAPVHDFNNTPTLQNATINLGLSGPVVSAKFQGVFGTDADVIASNGQSRSGVTLNQAYLQFARGPITVIAGKYVTLAGAETIDTTADSNYSRSYLFGYAIPFTHTGVRATYAYNSKVSIVAGVNNGWDDWKFVGKKKTLEGGLALTPSPGYALLLQTYNGNDFVAGGNSALGLAPVFSNRMLYDGVLTVHATSALTLIANYDNGTQLAAPAAGFATAHWNGIAGYANYQLNTLYGVSLRKETFHDSAGGFRTGIPGQRVQSNTATLNYTPNGNLIFRGEYRLDASDGNNYTFRGAPAGVGRPHQSSLGIETVVKFP